MSNCPASDKIQGAKIPDLNCDNPAPESILRLPTTLPGVVGAGSIESGYQLTAADISNEWKANYYQVTSSGVSQNTSTNVCVDNISVNYDAFTWVDWLTPAQRLEGERAWIKQLECSENGGTGGMELGPVRPPITRQPITALPMPSVTITNKYSGGGGGGSGGGGGGIDYVFIDSPSVKVNVSGFGNSREVQHWVDSNILMSSDYSINVEESGSGSRFSGWDITATGQVRVNADSDLVYLRSAFDNSGNIRFAVDTSTDEIIGVLQPDCLVSELETIYVSESESSDVDRTQLNVEVNWMGVQIDESLSDFIEAVYDDPSLVLIRMKPLELGDGILVMKDGKLQVYPVTASTVLGGDENGQLTSIPYSDCETACEEPSSSSM